MAIDPRTATASAKDDYINRINSYIGKNVEPIDSPGVDLQHLLARTAQARASPFDTSDHTPWRPQVRAQGMGLTTLTVSIAQCACIPWAAIFWPLGNIECD